jgi:hypothetical protein
MKWTNDTLGGERRGRTAFYVWLVRTSKANWAKGCSLLSRVATQGRAFVVLVWTDTEEEEKYFLMLGREREIVRRLNRRFSIILAFIGCLARGVDGQLSTAGVGRNPSESPRIFDAASCPQVQRLENFCTTWFFTIHQHIQSTHSTFLFFSPWRNVQFGGEMCEQRKI